jgi:hypothetical protein
VEKRAYAVQMSFNVPDSERRVAEKAKEYFKYLTSLLKLSGEYLKLVAEPFKKYSPLDPDELVENRILLRKIERAVSRKFRKISRASRQCISLMHTFSMDTRTEEMMNSFNDAQEEVQKQVQTFLSIFSDLNSPEFGNNLISSVEAIRKQVNQLRQLINDRIIEHIDGNILAHNWYDTVSKKNQDQATQEKVPLMVELFRERQQALKR